MNIYHKSEQIVFLHKVRSKLGLLKAAKSSHRPTTLMPIKNETTFCMIRANEFLYHYHSVLAQKNRIKGQSHINTKKVTIFYYIPSCIAWWIISRPIHGRGVPCKQETTVGNAHQLDTWPLDTPNSYG